MARSCSSWAARSRSPAIRNTISRIKSPSAQLTSARSNQLESSTHHSPEAWDQRQQKKSPPKRAVPPCLLLAQRTTLIRPRAAWTVFVIGSSADLFVQQRTTPSIP